MKKYLIAMSLVFAMSAAGAHVAHATSIVGSSYPSDISASISSTLSGANLTLLVANTSGSESYLTSLAFQLPEGLGLTFDGAFLADGTTPLVHEQNNKTYEWTFGAVSGNDVGNREAVRPFKDELNVGLFTDGKFLGGKTVIGIADGDTAIFKFTVTDGSFTSLDPFLARFQEVNIADVESGGSDIATPTPIPGAAWLLGTGLFGLVGLRRRFRQ